MGYNPSYKWTNPTYPIYNWGYNPLTKWDEPQSTYSLFFRVSRYPHRFHQPESFSMNAVSEIIREQKAPGGAMILHQIQMQKRVIMKTLRDVTENFAKM